MGAATHDAGEELRLTPSAQRVLGVVVQSRREREGLVQRLLRVAILSACLVRQWFSNSARVTAGFCSKSEATEYRVIRSQQELLQSQASWHPWIHLNPALAQVQKQKPN